MKKIDFNYGEFIYSEKLENGITVYMYPTTKSKNFYITVSTHFGAEVMKYRSGSKVYDVTKGSAHFLEHRVIDFTKNKDAMDEINKLGSIANAYTTYNGTNYNIYGEENILENIRLLFDRVFKADIKKEDVESERGIILEEYYMYQTDPYFKAQTTLFDNAFNKSFIKSLVIGTEEGIKSVTCEELNRLYKDFYTPENMFIVVTGNFDKESVLDYIKDYMKSVKIKNTSALIVRPKEEYKVNVSYAEVSKDILEAKVVIGYKIKVGKGSKLNTRIMLEMVISENFGKTGKSYLRLMNEGLNRFDYFTEEVDDYLILVFTASTNSVDKFEKIVNEELSSLEFTTESLDRKKKGYISNLILSFEDIVNVEDMITTNILCYNKLLNKMGDVVKEYKLSEVKDVIKLIDINNKSVLVMKK